MEVIHAGTGKMMKCLRNGIPLDYRKEVVQLLKLAGPLTLAELLSFLIPFVSFVFCGHLGKTELAGVGLATAVVNIAGLSVGSGLASVCNILISQTFGSSNLKRMGVILQRSILILLLACCPCWAILINTESILLAFKQSPEVARLSQMYVKIFMPALPAAFMFQLQGRYLQNQGVVWPQVITGIVGNVLNALMNYVFVFVLDLGIAGSAAANTATQFCLALFLFAYIHCKGLHKATWEGWSMECLREWGSFISLAIPSMLMLCVQLWIRDTGGFLAGLISEEELGTQSMICQLSSATFQLFIGLNSAASVRVGNALGAGNAQQARLSAKVTIIFTAIAAIVVAGVVGTSKDAMAIVFTNNEQIRRRFAEVVIMFIPISFVAPVSAVTSGILRGVAKQKIGAISTLVCCCCAIPIRVSLMFAAKLGITGFWAGDLTYYVLLAGFRLAFIAKLDWKKAAFEAQVRAGVATADEREQALAKECDYHVLADMEIHDEEDSDWEITSELEPMCERERGALSTVGKVLSVRQLVLRRVLVLCAMLAILAAGVLAHVLLPAILR